MMFTIVAVGLARSWDVVLQRCAMTQGGIDELRATAACMAFRRDREQQLELDNCNVFISISDLDASKVRLCDAIVFCREKRAQGQQRE
jgi:hypothetical protein